MVNKISVVNNTISYAKRTGLRSMQHITGVEREIIESYKSELPHEIWGDSAKLIEWVKLKIEKLMNGDYPSKLLDREIVENSRNNLVKAWGELLKTDFKTSKKPFLQLKILNFVTGKLNENNKTLAPILRVDVFQDALFFSQRTGKSFKKIYMDLIKKARYHQLNINEEAVNSGNVRGTWYNLRTLNDSETIRYPILANKLNEFIMSVSQGSDWCIRNKYNLLREYKGAKFHIFIDDKGIPQLCLVAADDAEKTFLYVRGKEQYKPLAKNYKKLLSEFIEKHNLRESEVVNNEGFSRPILDFCK